MVDLHGIILADRSAVGLNELVMCRTSAPCHLRGGTGS